MICMAVAPLNGIADNESLWKYPTTPTATMTETAMEGYEQSRRTVIRKVATYTETANASITWTYYLDDDGNAIIGTQKETPAISNTTTGTVTIPTTLGGKTVVGIGDYAFVNCDKITSFSIPSTVKTIGNYAFFGCERLTSLTIPDNVKTIGGHAFWYCHNITSLTIPKGVVSIGNCAFSYWYALKSITVDSNNPVFDSRDGCNAVIETATNTLVVSCQNTKIPNTVTSLRDYAFFGCGNLTSITIPSSVTDIGYENFNCCYSLTSMIVEGNNPIYDSRNNCNAIIETATNTLVAGCQKTEIPNSIVTIGQCAFWGCRNVETFTIPNSVKTIDASAFGTCSDLTSISIPNSVTTIGRKAFYGCSKIISAVIPSSVQTIGNRVFSVCNNLTSLKVDEDNPYYDSRNDCNAIIWTSNNSLISGCQTTYIPDDVRSIAQYAFYGCYSLKAINIPNSVTIIGNYAFRGVPSTVGNFNDEGEVVIDGITCYIKNPYSINENIFEDYSAKLYVPKGTKAKYEATSAWNKFSIIEEMEESPVCDTDDLQKWINLLGRKGDKGTYSNPTEVPLCDSGLNLDTDISIDDNLQLLIDGTGNNTTKQLKLTGGRLSIKDYACGWTFRAVTISDGNRAINAPRHATQNVPSATSGISSIGNLYFDNSTMVAGNYTIENLVQGDMHFQNGATVEGNNNLINSGNVYIDGSCTINGLHHKQGGCVILTSQPTKPISIIINDAGEIDEDVPIVKCFRNFKGDIVGYKLTEEDAKKLTISLPEGYEWYYDAEAIAIYVKVATNIENVNIGQSKVVSTYDILGRKVCDSSKGLRIQRMSDGTVRKQYSTNK